MENRKELIEKIIELHNLFTIEFNNFMNYPIDENSIWNKDLINIKFDRYYLVESSSHNEEDFSVKVEVRYALRSQEANAYGPKHDYYYKRYKSTIAFSYEDINNPEGYKKKLAESFKKSKENTILNEK